MSGQYWMKTDGWLRDRRRRNCMSHIWNKSKMTLNETYTVYGNIAHGSLAVFLNFSGGFNSLV